MVEEWNEAHEGELLVEYIYTPTTAGTQLSEKLMTNIAAGTPPEVARFDRFLVPTWGAQGALTDLKERFNQAGIKEEDYFPFAWDEATWGGAVYCLPYDTDDRAFYFNKTHIREAGYDPDNMPTDIDEINEMGKKLTIREGPRIKQLGWIPWRLGVEMCGFLWNGEFYDPDTYELTMNHPQTVRGCEWMVERAEEWDIEVIDTFSEAFGGGAQQAFTSGLVSMEFGGSWMIANHDRYAPDLDYMTMPHPWPTDEGRKATWAGGWSYVIPKGAPNQDAGWEFLEHHCSPEMVHRFCMETSHIPTQIEYAEDPFYTSDPRHKVFMDLFPIANCRPPLPCGQLVWNSFREIRDLMIHGKGEPQDLLDDLQEKASKEMEKYL
jgi:multiple sugar transport system substrate-binding protein